MKYFAHRLVLLLVVAFNIRSEPGHPEGLFRLALNS